MMSVVGLKRPAGGNLPPMPTASPTPLTEDRSPAQERNALEAPASSENPERQEPPEQRVPRLEPRNKDINSDRVKYGIKYA